MAANQGNINAQIDLYEIFYVGEYVEENDKEAFKWIKMAAQQGNAEAECNTRVRFCLQNRGFTFVSKR